MLDTNLQSVLQSVEYQTAKCTAKCRMLATSRPRSRCPHYLCLSERNLANFEVRKEGNACVGISTDETVPASRH